MRNKSQILCPPGVSCLVESQTINTQDNGARQGDGGGGCCIQEGQERWSQGDDSSGDQRSQNELCGVRWDSTDCRTVMGNSDEGDRGQGWSGR